MSKYSVFLLTTACVLTSVTSFQCHTCDSVSSSACLDPFSPEGGGTWISECGGQGRERGEAAILELLHQHFPGVANPAEKFTPASVCFKAIYIKEDRNVTFRSCSFLGEDTCQLLTAATEAEGGTMKFCESCDNRGLCNSATAVAAYTFSIFLLSILSCSFK